MLYPIHSILFMLTAVNIPILLSTSSQLFLLFLRFPILSCSYILLMFAKSGLLYNAYFYMPHSIHSLCLSCSVHARPLCSACLPIRFYLCAYSLPSTYLHLYLHFALCLGCVCIYLTNKHPRLHPIAAPLCSKSFGCLIQPLPQIIAVVPTLKPYCSYDLGQMLLLLYNENAGQHNPYVFAWQPLAYRLL